MQSAYEDPASTGYVPVETEDCKDVHKENVKDALTDLEQETSVKKWTIMKLRSVLTHDNQKGKDDGKNILNTKMTFGNFEWDGFPKWIDITFGDTPATKKDFLNYINAPDNTMNDLQEYLRKKLLESSIRQSN